MNLWPKRKPEPVYTRTESVEWGTSCELCGHTEFEEKGQRKGRCLKCGWPRNPVLIKAKVHEKTGRRTVVKEKVCMVSEEALGELRRS